MKNRYIPTCLSRGATPVLMLAGVAAVMSALALMLPVGGLRAQTTLTEANCQKCPTADLKSPALAPGSVVQVNFGVGESRFSYVEQQALIQVLNNWQNHSGNRTGIRFVPMNVGSLDRGLEVYLQAPAPDQTGYVPSGSLSSSIVENGHLVAGVIKLHPSLIWQNQLNGYGPLMQTMAHEIGHAMGLGDCPNCCNGVSVMKGPPKNATFTDETHGRDSPSSCDIAEANNAVGEPTPEPTPSPTSPGAPGEPSPGGDDCTHYEWRIYKTDRSTGYSWVETVYVGCLPD